MAALTPTLVKSILIGGGKEVLKIFTVPPEADGDTVALSSYFDTILSAKANITGGYDANFCELNTTFSGTTVTIAEKKADASTAADDWTSGQITLEVIGTHSDVNNP